MAKQQHTVTRGDARKSLLEWMHQRLGLPWNQGREMVRAGQVLLDDRPCRDPKRQLQRGQRVTIDNPSRQLQRSRPAVKKQPPAHASRSPASDPTPPEGGPVVRYSDAHIVVLDKPAGLTTVRHAHESAEFGTRGRRYLPQTLADLLPSLLGEAGGRPPRVRAVHRLDKETSGLVVFARTAEAERNLGQQFRAHSTERTYLAIVRGQAKDQTIESWLVPDRGDGRRGSRSTPGQGQHAVTHVRVLERLGSCTLVECRLETGRTHQVRIHLGEAGLPLCGERVYDRPLHGRPLPDGSGARRITLHAARLGFDHPASGKRMRWTAPLPRDMKDLLQRLRRTAKHRK